MAQWRGTSIPSPLLSFGYFRMNDSFRLHFISTVLWCQLHADESDPKGSLRTPELRPSNWLGGDYLWGEGTLETVARLEKKRAELLRSKGSVEVSQEQVSGRLLIADPESSDQCGLSVWESSGFIDDLDVPAWDTWIHYAHQETTAGGNTVSYLLCWVPTVFLPHVEKGISVNPVECFFWAAEYKERHYNTALLRQLDAQGLLG